MMRGGRNDAPCLEGCLTLIHAIAELLLYRPLQLRHREKHKLKRSEAIEVHFEYYERADSPVEHWVCRLDEPLTYSFIYKMNLRMPPFISWTNHVFLVNNRLQSLYI